MAPSANDSKDTIYTHGCLPSNFFRRQRALSVIKWGGAHSVRHCGWIGPRAGRRRGSARSTHTTRLQRVIIFLLSRARPALRKACTPTSTRGAQRFSSLAHPATDCTLAPLPPKEHVDWNFKEINDSVPPFVVVTGTASGGEGVGRSEEWVYVTERKKMGEVFASL